MPQFRTTRRVRHSAADMFALVADVERYPEFVPLCRALAVRRRVESGEGVEIVTANMTVAYKLLQETFTSRVTLDRPRLAITVEYLDGPFSHLDNRWHFRALDHDDFGLNQSKIINVIDSKSLERDAGGKPVPTFPHPALGANECEVEFFISYAFRSRTLGFVMGSVFDAAFRRFAAAFEARADALYGTARAQAG